MLEPAARSRASAARTTSRTGVLPEASRYSPTPRLILCERSSAAKAADRPRMGSGGAEGTRSNTASHRF
ncbi:MAG TPA: hypothetical protein DGN59_23415 [Candidatus Latescibacteria bacterium]|nr:hypothetical protein [Candidatus Latescibacterota bacterium]